MKNKLISIIVILFVCIIPMFFCGCNDEIKDHSIFVSSENQRYSSVQGGGVFKTNTEITISATAKGSLSNDEFVVWLKDGFIASYDRVFTFKVNSETEGKYVAVFNHEYLNLWTVENILFELALPEGSKIDKLSNVKIQLDNKQYYQQTIYENKEDIDGLKLELNSENLESKFVISPVIINSCSKVFGTITMTYKDTTNNLAVTDEIAFEPIFNDDTTNTETETSETKEISNIFVSCLKNNQTIKINFKKLKKEAV